MFDDAGTCLMTNSEQLMMLLGYQFMPLRKSTQIHQAGHPFS